MTDIIDEMAVRHDLGRVAALGEYLGRKRPAVRRAAAELVTACDLLSTAVFGMAAQPDAPRCSPAKARAILRAIEPELDVPDSEIAAKTARDCHAAALEALRVLCPTGGVAAREPVEAVSVSRPTGEG